MASKKDGWLVKKFPIANFGFWGEEIQVVDDSVFQDEGKKKKGKSVRLNKYWLVEDEYEHQSYKIKTPERWFEIKKIIEAEAFPLIGWNLPKADLDQLKKEKEAKSKIETKIKDILEKNPLIINTLLENIDVTSLREGDIHFISGLIKNLDNKILEAEEGAKLSFKQVIKGISSADKKAIDQLNELLQKWNLLNLTSVSTILCRRLKTLDIFEEMITKDETYEIQGDNSIHRILEKNMWIIDETYWLMQGNKSLRIFIGDEILKKDKSEAKKRPDFVCSTMDKKLIIVEIKKPSLIIGKKEVDQIENYTILAEDYKSKDFSRIEAYLVGNKFSPQAIKLLKKRTEIRRMSYNDLIEKTKYVYEEYLKKLEEIENEKLSKSKGNKGLTTK